MRGGVLAALACLVLANVQVRAQYVDYYASQQNLPLPGARPSVRLLGMGDLSLTIPDENNEINLSDFGRNLAGLATDRDGWSLEGWGGRQVGLDDYFSPLPTGTIRQRIRTEGEIGGLDAVYHKNGERAIGITTNWVGREASYRYGPDSRTRGPNVQAFINEVRGPVSLAVGVLRWNDNEDVVSDDVFAIRHFSTTWTTSFASALKLSDWQLGGEIDLDHVAIRGRSRDPAGFHQDDFEWRRPTKHFRVQLIRPEGKRLTAGLNLSALRRDGREQAEISWSDRFPYNPSRANFKLTVPTFGEKERSWTADGRALYRIISNVNLGLAGSYTKLDTDVTEAPLANFVGSRRAEDSVRKSWRVGGGIAGAFLGERLRLGVEGFGLGSKLNSKLVRSALETTSRSYAVHCGGEVLLPSRFAVRAGYVRTSVDEDVDAPQSLYAGNGLSLGLGYLPEGGLMSIDAALRFLQERPDFTGGPDRKRDTQEFAVSARFLR